MLKADTKAVLQLLARELAQVLGDQLDAIYLYGSYARGEAGQGSDLDVLVIVRGGFDYGDLIRRTSGTVSRLSLEHDIVISRAFVSKEQFDNGRNPFLQNVRREGVAV